MLVCATDSRSTCRKRTVALEELVSTPPDQLWARLSTELLTASADDQGYFAGGGSDESERGEGQQAEEDNEEGAVGAMGALCIKPAADGCSTGVARLATAADLAEYARALADGRPALLPGTLSTPHPRIELPVRLLLPTRRSGLGGVGWLLLVCSEGTPLRAICLDGCTVLAKGEDDVKPDFMTML